LNGLNYYWFLSILFYFHASLFLPFLKHSGVSFVNFHIYGIAVIFTAVSNWERSTHALFGINVMATMLTALRATWSCFHVSMFGCAHGPRGVFVFNRLNKCSEIVMATRRKNVNFLTPIF
jgi:hypothetical protein